jgi:hypothetical protein
MRSIKAVVRRYRTWCVSNSLVPFPVHYLSIAGFLCHHVSINGGSAKSVNNIISAIKTQCNLCSLPWLSAHDWLLVSKVKSQLQLVDSSPIARKRPFTTHMLRDLLLLVNLDDQSQYLSLMLMWMCHDALLRSGELFSGILCSDLEWHLSSSFVSLSLLRSKANRKGPPEIIQIMDYEGVCSYKLLLAWYTRHKLWNCKHKVLVPTITSLYPSVSFNFNITASISWWRSILNKSIKLLNLNPKLFSGHSFRAGGATDLFNAGVPTVIIKKMGRWKSDAVMIYHRDEIEVGRKVAAAFGSQI